MDHKIAVIASALFMALTMTACGSGEPASAPSVAETDKAAVREKLNMRESKADDKQSDNSDVTTQADAETPTDSDGTNILVAYFSRADENYNVGTIDRTLLSSGDMQAILSGLRSLDSVSDTNRYRQLMEKLSADDVTSVNADNHIIIDLSSWDKSAIADKIELIKQAIEQRNLITFRYFSPGGESERRIEPYHLIFQWSAWYVWGYCTERQDYRMFKLTRMTELAITDDRCEDRVIPEYTSDKLRHTRGEIKATVKFDTSVKWRIIDEFGADFLKYDDSGDLVMEFTWSDKQSFFNYILTFGDRAEIVSPPEYRQEFAELAKKIYSKYET